MSDERDSIKFSELPDSAKVLPKELAAKVAELLQDVDDLEQAIEASEESLAQKKAALELLQADQPGLRVGDLCFVSRMTVGRRSLDKVMLLENGVSKQQLDASYKMGKSYTTKTFKNLKRNRKGGDKSNAQTDP